MRNNLSETASDAQQRIRVARGVDALLTEFCRKLQRILGGTRTFGSITVSYRSGKVHIWKHEQHAKPFADTHRERQQEPGIDNEVSSEYPQYDSGAEETADN
jgi:hypothetical protein